MSSGQPLEERRKCLVANCQKPEEAAKKAVKHVFEILGVNVDDPQQVENFRKGLRFGEEMLQMTKKGKVAMMFSIISLATAAAWYAMWGKP